MTVQELIDRLELLDKDKDIKVNNYDNIIEIKLSKYVENENDDWYVIKSY